MTALFVRSGVFLMMVLIINAFAMCFTYGGPEYLNGLDYFINQPTMWGPMYDRLVIWLPRVVRWRGGDRRDCINNRGNVTEEIAKYTWEKWLFTLLRFHLWLHSGNERKTIEGRFRFQEKTKMKSRCRNQVLVSVSIMLIAPNGVYVSSCILYVLHFKMTWCLITKFLISIENSSLIAGTDFTDLYECQFGLNEITHINQPVERVILITYLCLMQSNDVRTRCENEFVM